MEPADHEDRNDSGINSSPGSDRSDNPAFSVPELNVNGSIFMTPVNNLSPFQASGMHQPTERNGTSSPSSSSRHSPPLTQYPIKTERPDFFSDEQPSTSSDHNGAEDALKMLELSLEKNTPQNKNPPKSENPQREKQDDSIDNEWRTPKYNANGKVKSYKCKECDAVFVTKVQYWEHALTHNNGKPRLICPDCPFNTQYKHHFEYHLHIHRGSKPFKCEHCDYTCVSKSMLKSHLKSHSNIYQYVCATCDYVSKYHHSFKVHLRKRNHVPGVILNEDGTPNPNSVIDIYGRRRGPKIKKQPHKPAEEAGTMALNTPYQPLMFPGAIKPPLTMFPFLANIFLNNMRAMQASSLMGNQTAQPEQSPVSTDQNDEEEGEVLDLSKPTESRASGNDTQSSDEEETTMFSNVEVVQSSADQQEEEDRSKTINNNSQSANNENLYCQYCSIHFGDAILHSLHMGCHAHNKPFTCNMCGMECKDKVDFHLHITHHPHF